MKTKRVRQEEAEQRQNEYSTLTQVERLAKLDAKLGAGAGAVRERKKIAKVLAAEKKAVDKKEKK